MAVAIQRLSFQSSWSWSADRHARDAVALLAYQPGHKTLGTMKVQKGHVAPVAEIMPLPKNGKDPKPAPG
jgi:hypothetical protein